MTSQKKDKTEIGQLEPTDTGYYLVNLPEITGNRNYYPIYIGPIGSYTQMIEATKANKAEHYVIYWDGYKQYTIQM